MCQTPFDPLTKQYFARLPYLEQKLLWELELQGSLTKVTTHEVEPSGNPFGKTSRITTFSRRSRTRLLQWLSRIDWQQIKKGIFVTLTYPDDRIELDPTRRNSQRWQWHRDMENHLGRQFPLVWRIEYEPRKSGKRLGEVLPHFHLICPSVRWIDKEFVTDTWRRITGAKGALSVKVKSLSNEKVHAIYVAKYTAKIPSSCNLDDVSYLNIRGRHWGFHRPLKIPYAEKTKFVDLPLSLVVKLQTAASQWAPYYDPMLDTGFCIFGSFGKKIVSYIRKLCLDEGIVPCLE